MIRQDKLQVREAPLVPVAQNQRHTLLSTPFMSAQSLLSSPSAPFPSLCPSLQRSHRVSVSFPPSGAASSVCTLHQSPTLATAPRMYLPFLLPAKGCPEATDIRNMHTNRAAPASTSVGEPQTRHTGAGTRAGAAPMEQEAPQEAADGPS